MGHNSEEFCTKWCKTLNKASFDFIVLVIEHTQVKNLVKIQAQIHSSQE